MATARPTLESVEECFASLPVAEIREEISLSALMRPAVTPTIGTNQLKSSIRALKGLLQISFWSWARLLMKTGGTSDAGCGSSAVWQGAITARVNEINSVADLSFAIRTEAKSNRTTEARRKSEIRLSKN